MEEIRQVTARFASEDGPALEFAIDDEEVPRDGVAPKWPDGMLYHGTLFRIGPPGSDRATAREVCGRVAQDIPAEIAPDLERVPGAPLEMFDFYDWDTDELVIVTRTLYRQRRGGPGK